jgi:hypothetical protein
MLDILVNGYTARASVEYISQDQFMILDTVSTALGLGYLFPLLLLLQKLSVQKNKLTRTLLENIRRVLFILTRKAIEQRIRKSAYFSRTECELCADATSVLEKQCYQLLDDHWKLSRSSKYNKLFYKLIRLEIRIVSLIQSMRIIVSKKGVDQGTSVWTKLKQSVSRSSDGALSYFITKVREGKSGQLDANDAIVLCKVIVTVIMY